MEAITMDDGAKIPREFVEAQLAKLAGRIRAALANRVAGVVDRVVGDEFDAAAEKAVAGMLKQETRVTAARKAEMRKRAVEAARCNRWDAVMLIGATTARLTGLAHSGTAVLVLYRDGRAEFHSADAWLQSAARGEFDSPGGDAAGIARFVADALIEADRKCAAGG